MKIVYQKRKPQLKSVKFDSSLTESEGLLSQNDKFKTIYTISAIRGIFLLRDEARKYQFVLTNT